MGRQQVTAAQQGVTASQRRVTAESKRRNRGIKTVLTCLLELMELRCPMLLVSVTTMAEGKRGE